MIEFLFWFFVIPATLASLYSIRTGRAYQEHVEFELREPDPENDEEEPPYTPPATLILPVKGVDHDFARNLRSFAGQDYPDFELIIVCWSASDDALRVAQITLGENFRLVVAPPAPEDTGEKINNLLAAVAAARPESEVFVFADSDAQVAPTWMRSLVAPLREEQTGASTGFRWYFPDDGGFWPLLRSVWDSTIAGNMRPDGKNFAWGGSMAIRRETFNTARVAEYWRGTVSDDYRLTKALNDAGLGIHFAPGAMAATTGGCTRDEFLSWARRQLIITKVYRGHLWAAGLVSHIVYCGAMVASVALAATGNPLGLGGLVTSVIPGMGKGGMRGYLGRVMFPAREDYFDRFGWIYFWMTPIATWVWLYLFLASARGRVIEWRGNTYELLSDSQTRCVSGHTPNKSQDR